MIAALVRRMGALALLILAGAGLQLAGHLLEQPPLTDPTRWMEADPVLLATTLVGGVAMVACAWLAMVTVIESIAMALHLHPLRRMAVVMAPAAWRSLVLRPVAIATMTLPPLAMPMVTAAPAMASTVSASDIDQDGELAPQLEMRPFHAGQATPTLTMRYLGPESDPNDAPVPDSVPPASAGSETSSAEGLLRVVGPGENLWAIATSHLAEATGSPPSPTEVTRYWQALIEANRQALPDPDNPDLIYQGIELTMPSVS